jgi:hypothetical protein
MMEVPMIRGPSSPRIARRKTRVNALMPGTHIPEAVVMGPRFRGDDSMYEQLMNRIRYEMLSRRREAR